MRAFLSDYKVAKVLLDSAHDAMPSTTELFT